MAIKRHKIVNDLMGQRLVTQQALADREPYDRSDPKFVDGYWYGRLTSLDDALRLLTEGTDNGREADEDTEPAAPPS